MAVITVLYSFGALALRFVLGDSAPAGNVACGLPATVLLNLLLTLAGLHARPPPAAAARAGRPRCTRSAASLAAADSRRFLPSDPRVEEPYLLTPQLALRVAILGFVALALFAVLFLRLWALQVLSGDTYAEGKRQPRAQRPVDAPRGAIIDRNGRVLVRNVSARASWCGRPTCRRIARRGALELQRLSTRRRHAPRAVEARIRAHAGDPLTPVVIRRRIHEDQHSYIAEHEGQFPGVGLEPSYLRQYPHRPLAAHILGHVGESRRRTHGDEE